ncbi:MULTISPECIES: PfkB family carbohydrate kinase [Kitasatospora]|uniref:Putative adenosine kinase n=1 Tax=Kitasatospora setae (strain ATCC 33774 / DSM 43861 / JCM 3304 / KCC A-0304 / NBRC 14216 / KM-6054) TaxID=452652 RepID=E4NIQ8_KITSK|nr:MULTISPECIES: PfkB family carbohydrate kinase [Kitasatospora]BAJ32856.1 putative adenosine kinase [Kitasatospora setae KM-6054]
MRIAVTGPIVIDNLMTFPGRFTSQLLPTQLQHLSLSFLVDDLEVRYGGVAANVAFGLGRLGRAPLLLGAAGRDFGEYRARLEEVGVDTSRVRVSAGLATARYTRTTDADDNRIVSYHSGALAEDDAPGPEGWPEDVGLVFLGPAEPELLVARAAECRRRGLPYLVDVAGRTEQLGRAGADAVLTGATHLVTNRRERAALLEHAGWAATDVLSRVGSWITTLGPEGVWIDYAASPSVAVPAAPISRLPDGAGGGGAFRAGFLAAKADGLDDEQAARTGCVLAAYALESAGSQEYRFTRPAFDARLDDAYAVTADTGW